MKALIRELFHVSIVKTIYINFAALPFKQAVKIPVVVSRGVKLDGPLAPNAIVLKGRIRTASILLGIGGSRDLAVFRSRKSYLRISRAGRLVFEGTARFAPHFSVLIDNAEMSIGSGFSCNNGCSFSCLDGIAIGENCLLGGDIEIRDSDGHTIYELDAEQHLVEKDNTKPVKIGDHVWLCSHVRISKGVRIGNDCVVAHSSICTRALEGNHKLIAGFPAKVIKDNIQWKK